MGNDFKIPAMTEDWELPDPLTPREAADQERVDYSTVIRWCQSGRLVARQLGGGDGPWRIRRADWIAFKVANAGLLARQKQRSDKAPGRSRQKAADLVLDGV